GDSPGELRGVQGEHRWYRGDETLPHAMFARYAPHANHFEATFWAGPQVVLPDPDDPILILISFRFAFMPAYDTL
ncbi:MAG TPA: hypothetical protein VMW64_06005, partial [Dehalococcoidia bacterium]|nr:hypothetical protein [Dehalococcoidia bacterium]